MGQLYSITYHQIAANSSRDFSPGDGYLVLMVSSGRCRTCIENAEFVCTQTDMVLLKPHMVQSLDTVGMNGPCSVICLRFSMEALEKYSDDQCSLTRNYQYVPFKTALIHCEIHNAVTLKNLVNRLISLKEDPMRLGLSIYENNLLSTFLVLFLRECTKCDLYYKKARNRNLIIDNVCLFIREHLTEDLSVKRLEQQFFVSGEVLSAKFKRATGMTLHQYIVKARIDLSKQYILQGLPIKNVYTLCGFGSYNHFFKAFKKVCRMTPRAYLNGKSDMSLEEPTEDGQNV